MRTYPFQNAALPIDERVKDLMGRMTIEEKARQLTCTMVTSMPDEEAFKDGMGEVIVFAGPLPAKDTAGMVRRLQDMAMGKSRFGIPALFHVEALAGPMVEGCGVFPTSISLGATFAPELVRGVADRTREQLVNLGIRQALSPVLDLVRDFRWGRTSEDYSSDPTLVSEMACAYVSGLQGDDLKNGVVATAKHFLGYSMTEGGINGARAQTDWRDIRENFAKPFEAAIRKANLRGVMTSYNEVNGELTSGSKKILTDLLRDDLGFSGMLVSDYTAIQSVDDDPVTAGIRCLKAGLDVELPSQCSYGDTLAAAVNDGMIDEAVVDRSLERVLRLKFELGLFEKPYGEFTDMDNSDNDAFAAKISKQVMTLTKNDGILPIRDKNKKIAVIGPTGNNLIMLNGSYSYPACEEMFMALMSGGSAGMEGVDVEGDAFVANEEKKRTMPDFTAALDDSIRSKHSGAKTIYEALLDFFPNTTYTQGCHIVRDSGFDADAAAKAAADADIVIMTVGGKIGMMVECTAGEGRDNVEIGLPGKQAELLRRVYEANPNMVIVHTDNKPLVDPFCYENVPAILEGWLPGIYGGNAIAKTLAGINNPGGRLPVDVLRHVGQTPVYHYQHVGCRSDAGMKSINPQGYCTISCSAELPFGHGLSYTTFSYENGKMKAVTDKKDAIPVITISIDVTNTGDMTGDEVVQLYGIDLKATIMRPQNELLGFKRISLNPGERKNVSFDFRLDQMAFPDADGKWILEKGDFQFYIGRNSNEHIFNGKFTQSDTIEIDHTKRDFFAKSKES